MCLDKLDERVKPCKTGYKVVRRREDGKLYGLHYGLDTLPLGDWLHEMEYRTEWDVRIDMDDGSSYPVGWHVYHEKPYKKCDQHVIVKVEVKEPIATGYEINWASMYGDSRKVTVAKKIKITEVLG